MRWCASPAAWPGAAAPMPSTSACRRSELARKPAGIDHAQAAAAPMSLLTAWQFLVELGHDETQPAPAPPTRNRCCWRARACSSTAPPGAWGTSRCRWPSSRARGSLPSRPAGTRPCCASWVLMSSSTTRQSKAGRPRPRCRSRRRCRGWPGLRALPAHAPSVAARYVPSFRWASMARLKPEKLGVSVSTTQVRSSGAQLAELAGLLDAGSDQSRDRQPLPAGRRPPRPTSARRADTSRARSCSRFGEGRCEHPQEGG